MSGPRAFARLSRPTTPGPTVPSCHSALDVSGDTAPVMRPGLLGHGPGMPIHDDLHAYAWVENPDGGFATWNPEITCP